MDSNKLSESDNSLIYLNYSELLQLVFNKLQSSQSFFKFSGQNNNKLIIDFDAISTQVAKSFQSSIILNEEYLAKFGSINFTDQCAQKFPAQIRQIYHFLDNQLFETSQNQDVVKSFLSEINNFKGNKTAINLIFNFPPLQGIKKQELTINPEKKRSDYCLKLHKVTIRVENLKEFESNVKKGVENYLEQEILPNINDEDQEDVLRDILEGETYKNDIEKVKKLVNTEALGQLNKYAMMQYLEYLSSHIDEHKENHQYVIYLRVLINRLKILNEYLNDPSKPDGDYEISYQGFTVNLRQILSRAEVYSCLPIIPIFSSSLGETTCRDQDFREFIFGVKMKLNGPVQKSKGESSFKYYLNLINPNSEAYKKEFNAETSEKEKETFVRKLLRVFCLYYFCLTCDSKLKYNDNYNINSEYNYNPLPNWEDRIITVFKGNDEGKKQNLLRNFANALLENKELAIETKINKLRTCLKDVLSYQTKLNPKTYPLHLSISKRILEKDEKIIEERGTFFKPEIGKKEALQYINIGEAKTNPQTFAKLRGNINIEDIRYFKTGKIQQFNLEYDLDNLQVLPVLFTPKDEKAKIEYAKNFSQTPLIVFPYDFENEKLNNTQYFNYYFTLFLLIYLTLKVITDKEKEKIFIPILRLHVSNRNKKDIPQDLDQDIGEFSKILVQLLGEKHLCNSQGYDLKNVNPHKTRNSLTSLYSVIPKKFSYQNPENNPQLEKLAIIVVSSRESDQKRYNSDRNKRISNLYGEVITINLLPDKKVKITTEKKLTANYSVGKMYSEPTIILDTVTNLSKKGYEHILYIAKTPFTSTLHLTTQSEDDEGLFFLSKKLIKYLSINNPNVKLYPIFCDQYYTRKIGSWKDESLSVENTKELINISQDLNQETVVFFNLINGRSVGKEEERFYNGVTSYSTLVGVYQDIMEDQHIRDNLLNDTPMKKDILKYLTLFHFYRFEKSETNSDKFNLKLNPYENIIGDKSVGEKSLFLHQKKQAEFNILAFLTEVRNAILEE